MKIPAFGQISTARRFLNARIRKANLLIADTFIKPYPLNISGEVDARAEDVSRFFRESPMITGVGAFTKSVNIEGPGKLSLDMSIPIGVPPEMVNDPKSPKFRIKGNYSLARGSAKPIVGPLISNVTGNIGFNEGGIKSNTITGVAYGNPMAVTIGGGGDAGVATDFAGRADVQQLGDLLTFALPQQITGTTDFSGRILAKNGAVEISVDSPMLGVTSTLPFPLAKRADEARRLKLVFANLGQTNETIRLDLLGNIARGAATDAAETPNRRTFFAEV